MFGGKTILIVEDDPVSTEFMKEVLLETRAKLICCITADESIKLVKINKDIDLILMDIKLPHKSGFFATKEILKIRKDLPIIAQTAYALEGDKQKCLDSGCVDYLSKPTLKEDLIAYVKRHI